MTKVFKVIAIITALSLLCIAIAGCAGTQTTTTTSKPPISTLTSTPPTSTPPTSKPPTSTPPTSKPPTSTPPTSKPPTSTPPVTGTGLLSIEVFPASLEGDNRFVNYIHVTANYGDGRKVEVTKQCTYTSSDRIIAYVVTKDMPGEDQFHPPVPGWYVVGAFPGSAIITISFTDGGVTKTCDLPVTVIFMMP